MLLMCACAAVCGAKSIDELAEFGERATNSLLASLGVRRHLLGWRCSPKPVTLGRVLQALDGDALDQAVGAYLADRHRITASADMPETRSRQSIAVDGKALTGSARLAAPRRHLLSAVTHDRVATIAQVEVGAKTNEVRHFKPLLAPLDLADTVVTFDALHSVKANITWLVETKKAHYIAVIKTNQPTAYAQLAALPWTSIKVQHTASATASAAASPARSKPALSPTTSAASLSPTPTSPSGSTAAASPPAGPKPARTSTRSPASPPIKPAPSTSPPPFAGIGESKILPTTSEMSRSLRTPRPFTPALHPAPWPPSATSPSAP
ncbi:ISAs1 family transposase [Streptomyces rectiviolaceus]|uniref:ISAs1 family transposase n=1 Tax=Streptomyces rectiviolaceus TaxID=332591 RepID=UPI003625709F